jgi:hypothetical protein
MTRVINEKIRHWTLTAATIILTQLSYSAQARPWTTTDYVAYTFAVTWCYKEEGVLTQKQSITVGVELNKWVSDKREITREQWERIIKEPTFNERWMSMIEEYGGCKGLLNAVKTNAI